ncbi:MAG: GNAT family N-acetyltransferase [Bacteroidia bacterium]
MSSIIIRQPNDAEFNSVKSYVKEYWLDDESMSKEQFKILLYEGNLAAFGRLKRHSDGIELCTLGVVEKFRNKNLGTAMVKGLLSGIGQDVYIVTVIPGFFTKLGFKATKEYPGSLQKKCDNCCNNYHVGQTYVVMKYSM